MDKMLDYNGEASVLLPWLYTYYQGFFEYGYGRGRVMKSMQLNAVTTEERCGDAISLEESDATLDEVMVVAYGTAKKRLCQGWTSNQQDVHRRQQRP